MIDAIRSLIDSWWVIGSWAAVVALCLIVVAVDMARRNPEIMALMKAVWLLTVAYSGPIGLTVYWTTGRKQIHHDSLWKRGWRSVSHCYSGCGIGEIAGITITAGILALPNLWVAVVTFTLAYVFGYALTVGPLMQDGVPLRTALRDALTAETASIFVMEVVAIGVDLLLAPQAGFTDPTFWGSLFISLSCGLLAAWPVNVLLIHYGIKEGMHDPREMAERHA